MDSICDILKSIVYSKKKIDTKFLPSQALFYKEDMKLFIKKAEKEDIVEYGTNFIKDDLAVVIQKVKTIVEKNVLLSDGYTFDDLKSIDVVFLFLEIVKYTKEKGIFVSYFDEDSNKVKKIEFCQKNFNYFNLPDEVMKFYDLENKCFKVNDYSYTLPSIGVENCITFYLVYKTQLDDKMDWENVFFDFSYFVGDKNFLTYDEIENLIQIFNYDLDEEELNKVKLTLKIFAPLQRYSLVKNGKSIDINSKIDLENIWN